MMKRSWSGTLRTASAVPYCPIAEGEGTTLRQQADGRLSIGATGEMLQKYKTTGLDPTLVICVIVVNLRWHGLEATHAVSWAADCC